MAKMVRIRTVCDGCAAEGRGDNDVDTATYGPVEGRTVDLCPEHRATLWDPLVEFFRTHGERPEQVRKRTTTTVARVVQSVPDGRVHTIPAPAPEAARPNKKTRRAGRKERARREAVMASHPSSSEVVTPLSTAHPCPLCAVVSATTNALQVHLSTKHGTTAGAVFGGTCPLCNHAGTPTGLGTHARMGHKVEGGVPALFRQAVAAGDPYGVVAARTEVVSKMLGATG